MGYITEADDEILKSLTNVELILKEDSSDYSIEFTFAANEYFTNDKLVIEVASDEEGNIEEINSTEINWKAGKNILEKNVEKKQKNKKTGKTRVINEIQKQESFFWIFGNYYSPDEEEDYDEGEDEEEDEDMEFSERNLFYKAQTIADFFRNSFFTFFIPSAFGLDIKEFQEDCFDFDGEDNEEIKDALKKQIQGKAGNNPECKQQ